MRSRFLIIGICWVLMAAANAATFKNPPLIPTGADVSGVSAADFNHDGIPDLAYVDGLSNPHALHILLGRGDGTFSHLQDIILPTGTCSFSWCMINVADVTGDGNLDILLGSRGEPSGFIVTLVGNGDGTFGQPIQAALPTTSLYPSVSGAFGIGDVNGDGAMDLVVPDALNSSLYVFLGDSTGNFTFSHMVTAYYVSSVSLADLNGDGKLDIFATLSLGGGNYVYFGNGDGTFQPGFQAISGAGNGYLLDADQDGHLDFITQQYPNNIVFYKGNGNGTFASGVTLTQVPTNASLVGYGDFNGDGLLDLAVLDSAGVGILLGKGNLTFAPAVSSLSGGNHLVTLSGNFPHLAQADFNGDGKIDIAMPVDGGIALLFGNGDGTFQSGDIYDIGSAAGALAAADFNGDNIADIAVTTTGAIPRLMFGSSTGVSPWARTRTTA